MNTEAELKQKWLRTIQRHSGYESQDEPIEDALRKWKLYFSICLWIQPLKEELGMPLNSPNIKEKRF